MPTNIKLGPDGGPFVELDEDTGDFIIRVPNDSVDFDLSELSNIANLVANSAEIDGNTSPYAQDPHDVGGAQHAADTLANLNSKVSDATLDDTNDTREPEAHSGTHESGGTDEVNVSGLVGELADPQKSDYRDGSTAVIETTELRAGTALELVENNGAAQINNTQPGVGWLEDGNSPKTVTNTNSISFTLANTFDIVRVFLRVELDLNRFQARLRVNGDSGSNYNFTDRLGNVTPGATEIPVTFFSEGTSGDEYYTTFDMSGVFGSEWHYGRASPLSNGGLNAINGSNDGISSPLTDFEVFDDQRDSNPNEITVEVYGKRV